MAHESFEDPEVGEALNSAFINIKVDREEHPTVDHFYMTACTVAGRPGGWPLTILATPDRRPFYCATYLPNAQIIKVAASNRDDLYRVLPHLEGYALKDSSETVYICRNRVCDAPITEYDLLQSVLNK